MVSSWECTLTCRSGWIVFPLGTRRTKRRRRFFTARSLKLFDAAAIDWLSSSAPVAISPANLSAFGYGQRTPNVGGPGRRCEQKSEETAVIIIIVVVAFFFFSRGRALRSQRKLHAPRLSPPPLPLQTSPSSRPTMDKSNTAKRQLRGERGGKKRRRRESARQPTQSRVSEATQPNAARLNEPDMLGEY